MQRSLCPVQPSHRGVFTKQYGPSFHRDCASVMAPGGSKTGMRNCWSTILFKMAMSDVDAGELTELDEVGAETGEEKNPPRVTDGLPQAVSYFKPLRLHHVCAPWDKQGQCTYLAAGSARLRLRQQARETRGPESQIPGA